jgi:putative membrane protein insertion efficiency factor
LDIVSIIRKLLVVIKTISIKCRYHPTCSTYARTALRERGFIESLYLITKRVLKCNPYSSGGIDYLKPKGSVHKNN